SNSFKCIPRNIDVFIAASGDYLYCYNDVGHKHSIGNVADMGIREVLAKREGMALIPELCNGCNMLHRYDAKELVKAGISYARTKLKAA
ncbi:MAG: hypothetical protein Q8J90_00200, partial [Gallionella sp.]|nr:hypothetical protein [Gallionella sp.]